MGPFAAEVEGDNANTGEKVSDGPIIEIMFASV